MPRLQILQRLIKSLHLDPITNYYDHEIQLHDREDLIVHNHVSTVSIQLPRATKVAQKNVQGNLSHCLSMCASSLMVFEDHEGWKSCPNDPCQQQ